jgi:nickel-type superoxide dismutase maturation protease
VRPSNWTLQCLPVYTQVVRRLLPLRRFVVEDTSMRPALQPGDRLFVFQWPRPKFNQGDLIVLKEPDRQLTFAIKRVASLAPNGDVIVHADNPNVSRDSREFGPVPRRLIVGRVIFRYLPGERRGRL